MKKQVEEGRKRITNTLEKEKERRISTHTNSGEKICKPILAKGDGRKEVWRGRGTKWGVVRGGEEGIRSRDDNPVGLPATKKLTGTEKDPSGMKKRRGG